MQEGNTCQEKRIIGNTATNNVRIEDQCLKHLYRVENYYALTSGRIREF